MKRNSIVILCYLKVVSPESYLETVGVIVNSSR